MLRRRCFEAWRYLLLVPATLMMPAVGVAIASVRSTQADTYHAPGRIVELVANRTTVAALVNVRNGCRVVRWRPGNRALATSAVTRAPRIPTAVGPTSGCALTATGSP